MAKNDDVVQPAEDPEEAAEQRADTEKAGGPEVVDDRRASRDATEGAKPRAPGVNTQVRVREQMHEPEVSAAGPEGQKARSASADEKKNKHRAAFLKVSGYKSSDILGTNEDTRTFVTANGGKYVISPKGTKIRVLSGPATPAMLEAAAEEEEEEE